ncbi:MAG: ATP-binding protein [Vulcanimicrobiota bacterium]
MQPLAERRANIRLNRVLAIEFVASDDSIRRFVVDVSATGVRVVSEEELPVGTTHSIRLHPKGSPLIEATARVVWCEELLTGGLFEVGLEFDEVDSLEVFQHLLDYLDRERLQGGDARVLALRDQLHLRDITATELERLAVLARISQLFSSSFTLQEVMDRVLQVLVEATGAERSLLLLDRGGDQYEVPAACGLAPEPDRRYSRRVTDQVHQSGQPLLLLDVSNDARFAQSSSLKIMGTRSVLCVPVRSEEKEFGLLYLDNSARAGVFTEVELQLASIIAGLAAAALERAEYFSKVVHGQKMAAVGSMMAGIMHELSDPLCSILAIGELLRSQGEELAPDLIEQAARCRDLVHKLLETARNQQSEVERIDLAELVRDTTSLMASQFQVQRVGLDVACEKCSVLGNLDRLRQVVINLLSNALHETKARPEGLVEVRVFERHEIAYLVVGDNGEGVPPQNMSRIFDPFFTTKPRGQGTGLGLSIANKAVVDHGGRIVLESREGGGALFTVELPAYREVDRQRVG